MRHKKKGATWSPAAAAAEGGGTCRRYGEREEVVEDGGQKRDQRASGLFGPPALGLF